MFTTDPALFWVSVSFAGFVSLLFYLRVPSLIAQQLDERSDRIRAELEEARSLREEAQSLLADCRRRNRDAEKEVESIISAAHSEVERYSKEAYSALQESLERRMKGAEERILSAERQALLSVRAKVVDRAIAAAKHLIAQRATLPVHSGLIHAGIDEIRGNMDKM